jgi:predicted PurR-regulated permease PerM
MVAVGTAVTLGLTVVGVPLALPLGILYGICEFVPVAGPIVGAIFGLLIAFTQGPQVMLYAALIYLVVQFAEGHFILPMVQKWAVSLPPAMGLLGVVVFGLIFGVPGVLFAMPLLVVTATLVRKLYVEPMERGG